MPGQLTFRTVDPTTGLTIEELPGARLNGGIVQVIGRGEPVTVEVPWPDDMPDRWRAATDPGRQLLICEDEDRIWWGGLIIARSFGDGPTLTVQADAPEGLLARGFVPDLALKQQPQTEIMATLGLDWLTSFIHGRVEVGATAQVRDRNYKADDDKSRLDAMQDLMGVINGPEFTTRWEKPSGVVELVCTTMDRIGLEATADEPPYVELYPDQWSYEESYADGKGAPIVRASKTTEGTAELAEDGSQEQGGQEKISVEVRDQVLLDAGFAPLEHRFAPETGSVKEEVIREYAEGRLAAISRGTITVTARCLIEDFPLNGELHLGDDVSLVLGPNELPPQGSPTMAPYGPGLDMLAGSILDLVDIGDGLGLDAGRTPTQIIADARLLGWALESESNSFTHVTAVLELKAVRGWH